LPSDISPIILENSSEPPYSVSSDLGKLDVSRHLTSGMPCAMAGAAIVDAAATPAAPTPAVLTNFLRFIFLCPPYRTPHMASAKRRNPDTQNCLWKAARPQKEPPPKRGRCRILQLARTFPAPYMRVRKLL